MLGLERVLDKYEAPRLDANPNGFITAMKFTGYINVDTLKRAIHSLGERYPVVRAHIRSENGTHTMCVTPKSVPILTVLDMDNSKRWPDQLAQLAEESADAHSSLWEFYLVTRDGNSGYVAFRTNHAVADGRHIFNGIWPSLWELYSCLAEGATPPPLDSVPSLPRSEQELLMERRGMDVLPVPDYTITEYLKNDRDDGASVEEGQNLAESVQLGTSETNKIIATAKKFQTSVHGLMCGALLTEIRGCDQRVGLVPMVCMGAVDLRTRTRPPIEPTEVTNFVYSYIVNLNVPNSPDPITIGREVKEQIESSIVQHRLYPPGYTLIGYQNYLGDRGVHSLLISNPGTLRAPNVSGLEFDSELHMMIVNSAGSANIENPETQDDLFDVINHIPTSAIRARSGMWTNYGRLTNGLQTLGPNIDNLLLQRSVNRLLSY